MCLALLALGTSKDRPLILALNRDEFLSRPTAPMHWWSTPEVLAGKDLEAGGTWFAIDKEGSFALVTNFRDPRRVRQGARSRGRLPLDFLASSKGAADFFEELVASQHWYNPFNILVHRDGETAWFESTSRRTEILGAGIHGMSNGPLNAPWPKIVRGKAGFAAALAGGASPETLFGVMRDSTPAPEGKLPDTGISADKELLLSPMFIQAPGYGTRATTLVVCSADGMAEVLERSYADGDSRTVRETFRVQTPSR